tara:strand:- start:347 stop:469 length:123 start_codon:yes stop_codon:yes gene_type:complete
MMHCKKCGYEWEVRVKTPKACPRCKTRLDAPVKENKEWQK